MRLSAENLSFTIQSPIFTYAVPVLRTEQILNTVAKLSKMTVQHLLGPRRGSKYVIPRQVAMLLIRECRPNLSLPQIARVFKRDHTTVIHGIRRARGHILEEPEVQDLYVAACTALGIKPVYAYQNPDASLRRCLTCGSMFMSAGPGNRICSSEKCQGLRSKVSPFEPECGDVIHFSSLGRKSA